jgi:type II secretory pathway component PulF
MEFYYKAFKSNGSVIEGRLDGRTLDEALAKIAGMDAKPLVVKPIGSAGKREGVFARGRISLEDKVFLTRYLGLMLKVGTDLFKAINILIDDFDKPAVKALLLEIRGNLEKGQPFYTTFARYPKTFSSSFVNLIKAGEVSGKLESVFEGLSVSLEKERDLRQKIKGALMYPVILLIASVFVMVLMVSFTIPRIANVFSGNGVQPPLFSKIVFAIGIFASNNLIVILTLLISVMVGGYIFFARTMVGRNMLYRIGIKTPAIGRVISETSLQQFAATLSSLLSSGMPIIDSLNVTADSISMPELKKALIRIGSEGLAKGLTVGEAFKREPIFPKVVSNLIAVSEKSGNLESILQTLADFYSSSIEGSLKTLVTFIEPILLLFIGVMIGSIALAVIIPVYQLTANF